MSEIYPLLILFFQGIMKNHFLRMALFASLGASVTGGVIGSYVVVKRIVFISGSIAHSVLGGMGLALYLQRVYHISWLDPLYGAFLASILSAWLIAWIRLYYQQREDTVIAALWAVGMSIGVIFISLTPGYNVELTSFLFGSILWTSTADLYTLFALDIFVLCVAFFFHRRFLAICFDEEQAVLQNQRVKLLYFFLLTLVAITVVLLIQVVGAILVLSFLSLPAAIANTFTHRLSKMMLVAILISMVISCLGMILSFAFNWPPGATLSLTATLLYLLNLIRRRG